jgi:predicted negative regulator of RcsB-dependent stress response
VELESINKEVKVLMDKIEKLKENGQINDAISIMKNELLPIMSNNGQRTYLAMAYTVLADLYQELGNTDEAVKTLQEQVLPRFLEEKNDFLSQLAHTMIANLLPDKNPKN